MSFADKILGILRDPPPEFVFEVAADGIAISCTHPPAAIQHVPLKPGVIAPSPVKENILDPTAFAEAVRKLTPPPTGRGKTGKGRRSAVLILPDNCVRIAVLDFDALPEKEEERRPLINFRLKKSVPFDVDQAALSYFPQAGKKVIVALAPSEIVAHYETPFRAAGFHPGLVTVSSLAMLDLLPVTSAQAAGSVLSDKIRSIVLAHRSPGALTVIALSDGIVTIVRSLEMGDSNTPDADPLDEIIAAIYPTLTYIEDQNGSRPERLFIAGFGEQSEPVSLRLSVELDIPVEPVLQLYPGLAGYLASVAPKHNLKHNKAAA
jgi:type IV pilus assembly protein PilM